MGYLRRTLQVRILIDMAMDQAMDSHTPATEYGCWEERLIRDQIIHNLIFSTLTYIKNASVARRHVPYVR